MSEREDRVEALVREAIANRGKIDWMTGVSDGEADRLSFLAERIAELEAFQKDVRGMIEGLRDGSSHRVYEALGIKPTGQSYYDMQDRVFDALAKVGIAEARRAELEVAARDVLGSAEDDGDYCHIVESQYIRKLSRLIYGGEGTPEVGDE